MTTKPLLLRQFFVRKKNTVDPYSFDFTTQSYDVYDQWSEVSTPQEFAWDNELLGKLDLLRACAGERPSSLQDTLGSTLATFLKPTGWSKHAHAIAEAIDHRRRVIITIQSSAAELYTLPWELTLLPHSRQHLGALRDVLIRYEWPGTRRDYGDTLAEPARILVAWSGDVDARAHVRAIREAAAKRRSPVIIHELANATYSSLYDALTRYRYRGFHLICHGAQHEGAFGLLLDDDAGEPEWIRPGGLSQLISSHVSTLRLVFLATCDGANPGQPGNLIGSPAQRVHQAGLQCVVASRYPIATAGAVEATRAFYDALLAREQSVETGVLDARATLARDHKRLDWASLQLYAREEDGQETRLFPYVLADTWEQALQRFMVANFDAHRLRNLLQTIARPVYTVLGEIEDIETLAPRAVQELARAGLVNEKLFTVLRGRRDRYAIQVEPIRELWRSQSGSVPEVSVKPARSRVAVKKQISVPRPARGQPTHTAIVLDRIHQWRRILKACAEDKRDLLFLVHASREQDLEVFMQRIRQFLARECSRRHHVLRVEQKADHSSAVSAEDWERQVLRATAARVRPFGYAIQREARDVAPLFLFEDRDGPLHNPSPETVEGLRGFLRGQLAGALNMGQRLNPIRIVIPIEHHWTEARRDQYLKRLSALGQNCPLRVEPALELHFPTQKDVEDHIDTDDVFMNIDAETRARCIAVYQEVTASPERSLQQLGDRLHEILFKWESDRW